MTTYSLESLKENMESMATEINGKWVPCRPINYTVRSWTQKIVEAWKVYKGELDSVRWPEGQ